MGDIIYLYDTLLVVLRVLKMSFSGNQDPVSQNNAETGYEQLNTGETFFFFYDSQEESTPSWAKDINAYTLPYYEPLVLNRSLFPSTQFVP